METEKVCVVALAVSLAVTAFGGNPTAARVSRVFDRMGRSTAEHPETVRVLFYGQSIVGQDWGMKFIVPELKRRYPTVRSPSRNPAAASTTNKQKKERNTRFRHIAVRKGAEGPKGDRRGRNE